MSAEEAIDGIDRGRVEAWFEANVEDAATPLSFELIAGGRSNLTYGVDGRKRASLGAAAAADRQDARLARTTWAGRRRSSRLSRARTCRSRPSPGYCTDEGVNEAPFYVMDFVEGPILRMRPDADPYDEAQQRQIGLNVIDTLVDIHCARPRRGGPRRPGEEGGLRRAHAQALAGPVGQGAHPRDPADRRGPRAPRGTDPRAGSRDDRPRRLPPRQHDPHARRKQGGRGRRLGAFDARRSARRRRHAPRLLGRSRRRALSALRARHHGAGFPLARRGREAATPSARAAISSSSTSTWRSACGSSRSSSRASTRATRQGSTATRSTTTSRAFGENVVKLAEAADEAERRLG